MTALDDRNQAARAACFAVDTFAIDNARALEQLPRATQSRLLVEVALGYLFGHGLVQLTEWPEYLPMQLPDEMAPDMRAAAVANRTLRDALFPKGLPR